MATAVAAVDAIVERRRASIRRYRRRDDSIDDHGTPAECFDIVVLAEGFRDSELPQFDHLCQLPAVGLLNMPPFSEVQDLINVHTVKTVSRHSGIDDVPVKGVRKDTCFDVSGFFDGADYIGYVGTHRPELIYAAADLAAPLEHVEVMLVVVNSPLDGGSAFPGSRLAFVTHWDTTARFVNIAAHECAHVIAGLADEYINCTLKQPCESQANQATEPLQWSCRRGRRSWRQSARAAARPRRQPSAPAGTAATAWRR